jgi:hypothetical protein
MGSVNRIRRSLVGQFVGAYLRDVFGGWWWLINLAFGAFAVVSLIVPLPTRWPAWATPWTLFAATMFVAHVRGYWRAWSRTATAADLELTPDLLAIEPYVQTLHSGLSPTALGAELRIRCTNRSTRSLRDCGAVWQRFEMEDRPGIWRVPEWFEPFPLTWETGESRETLVAGGGEHSFALATLDPMTGMFATIPMARLLPWTLRAGRYRAVVVLTVDAYRARPAMFKFHWRDGDLHELAFD